MACRHDAEGRTIVLAEIGDCLVVGDKPAQEPHHLDVASRFPLQAPARLHPVEIAIDVELQKNRRMTGGPPGRRRLHSIEPKFGQIERVDKSVDDANRIALVDEIIEAFGQQGRLPAIRPRNEALQQWPPQIGGEL